MTLGLLTLTAILQANIALYHPWAYTEFTLLVATNKLMGFHSQLFQWQSVSYEVFCSTGKNNSEPLLWTQMSQILFYMFMSINPFKTIPTTTLCLRQYLQSLPAYGWEDSGKKKTQLTYVPKAVQLVKKRRETWILALPFRSSPPTHSTLVKMRAKLLAKSNSQMLTCLEFNLVTRTNMKVIPRPAKSWRSSHLRDCRPCCLMPQGSPEVQAPSEAPHTHPTLKRQPLTFIHFIC